jgi:hypothetical protein
MLNILQIYGGIIVPVSFCSFRGLSSVCSSYIQISQTEGKQTGKPFISETSNPGVSSNSFEYAPNTHFLGAPKHSEVIKKGIQFMQQLISTDYTAESVFKNKHAWIQDALKQNEIALVSGTMFGTKGENGNPIKIDDLFSENTITSLFLSSHALGIWLPSEEILKRNKYDWFSRCSIKQALDTPYLISKLLVYALSTQPNETEGFATFPKNDMPPLKRKQIIDQYIHFWQIPSGAPLWGLRPNNLGFVSQIPGPNISI